MSTRNELARPPRTRSAQTAGAHEMKPATFPRTIRQALGPYARLELHKPTPRWRIAVRTLVKGAAYFVAGMIGGAAFGSLLAFVERL